MSWVSFTSEVDFLWKSSHRRECALEFEILGRKVYGVAGNSTRTNTLGQLIVVGGNLERNGSQTGHVGYFKANQSRLVFATVIRSVAYYRISFK